jgi:deazaflavin-dependent oxidoreductase (nitroreductase family)
MVDEWDEKPHGQERPDRDDWPEAEVWIPRRVDVREVRRPVVPVIPRLWDLTGGALLMRSGRAGRLTTLGRKSGQPRTVQCGFVRRGDGTILVGSARGRQWPLNLATAGWCTFEARDVPSHRYVATSLDGAEREAAIAEIRAARGERAARAFSGHVFLLRPEAGSG